MVSKTVDVNNSITDRNNFNLGYFANNLEWCHIIYTCD
ncbi:protein of unknown function [Candidatus Promineifilum breve]|uniref:Uncharacterized protein n=1 Tax=Candidatus Promineifilum breve TaxID=1806508 RepID=A0A160T2G6_9CHLR|nr:protein of unknown function [Candidatus Promineifilum breve]